MGEKIKNWFFENLTIAFVWAVFIGGMRFIDSLNWRFIHGDILVLFLVSYWLKNTLFKKNG